jgi:hypothetical protein
MGFSPEPATPAYGTLGFHRSPLMRSFGDSPSSDEEFAQQALKRPLLILGRKQAMPPF